MRDAGRGPAPRTRPASGSGRAASPAGNGPGRPRRGVAGPAGRAEGSGGQRGPRTTGRDQAHPAQGENVRVIQSAPAFGEKARSRRRRSWRRLSLVVAVLGLIAALVWAICFSSILSVRQVEVEGLRGAGAAEVARVADVPRGVPLARVDTAAVRRRVLTIRSLAEASVSRRWPGTVVVRVERRVPRLVLRDGAKLKVADAQGVVYGTVETAPPKVPVVDVAGSDGATENGVRAALSVVTALPRHLSSEVTSIKVSSANLVTFTIGDVDVVWGGAGRAERKAALLRVLLTTSPDRVDVSAPDTPVTS